MDGMEANVTGVNETASAELSTGAETTTEGMTNTAAESTENTTGETGSVDVNAQGDTASETRQSAEDNSRFAAARRKAEAEYQAKIDKLNAMFKQQFGQYKNPETGAPITSAEEYLTAFNVQQRKQQEAQLQKAGLDPKLIQNMVDNNPAIREAKEIIARNQQEMAHQALENDLKAVSKIDPEIKTLEDLAAQPNYAEIVKYVSQNGLSLVDAYKLANNDKLVSRQTEAVKQAAINSAKSTAHLGVTGGVSTDTGNYVPIPANMLGAWRQAYPDLKDEELTKKYNAAL